MSNDNFAGDNIQGDKVMGDKVTYEINHVDLDIGVLNSILQNEPNIIKDTLISLNTIPSENNPDERTIPISEKNLINGLKDFYENFIKHKEQKLASIDKFVKDNDYIDEIEDAAESIKMFIFTYANRNSLKLEPFLFNAIIQEHTKSIDDIKKRNIMKLMIYYLYRYCYIGSKDA